LICIFDRKLKYIAKSGREKEKNLADLNNSRKRERKRLQSSRFLLSPFRAR